MVHDVVVRCIDLCCCKSDVCLSSEL